MQPFLVPKKVLIGIVEDLQKILVQILIIEDLLHQVLIHLLLESRGQEITVQDLMINKTIIIY